MHLPPRKRLDDHERQAFGVIMEHEASHMMAGEVEAEFLVEAVEHFMANEETAERLDLTRETKDILRRDGDKWQFSINNFVQIEVCRYPAYPMFTPVRTKGRMVDALNMLAEEEIEAVSRAIELASADHGWVVHCGCRHASNRKHEELAALDADLMSESLASDVEAWLNSQ